MNLLQRFSEQLDAVVDATARLATAAADRADAIDEARTRCEALAEDDSLRERWKVRRILVTEIACALRLPERSTETLIEQSRALVNEFPTTLAAVRSGTISYRHATILLDQAAGLGDADRASLETVMLPLAATMTAAKFTERVRQARERLDSESITARHDTCVSDRAVFFEPARDGMAYLTAYLPAAAAKAVFARVTTIAMGLQGTDETRTLTQLRADVLADLALTRTATGTDATGTAGGGIKPDVAILVPALTLLGRSDEPAVLEGYGPIDLDTAKELVGRATSFIRILTHPETGAWLSVGRSRYQAPKDLRTVLQLRDETCRHPGCNRPAATCDIDHTRAYAENGECGETSVTNLAHLCGKHHRDKHEIGWRLVQDPSGDGTLHWTSPTGRRYTTEPANRIGVALRALVRQSDPPPF